MADPLRRRGSLKKRLHHQRSRVLGKTKVVASQLERTSGAGKPQMVAGELKQVAGALATLRAQVIKEGGGRRTAKRAAQGLAHLEDSYKVLAQAQTTSDLRARGALVRQAVNHSRAAKVDAHAAGADWPL